MDLKATKIRETYWFGEGEKCSHKKLALELVVQVSSDERTSCRVEAGRSSWSDTWI